MDSFVFDGSCGPVETIIASMDSVNEVVFSGFFKTIVDDDYLTPSDKHLSSPCCVFINQCLQRRDLMRGSVILSLWHIVSTFLF